MPRNLDITSLRSFVTVAESGGVTRAAGLLHLTQSAVSMQLKRLEESLDTRLLERAGRGVGLTAAGEQLLSHARRLLEINDDIYRRMTSEDLEGELTLGVPHDIVYPAIPEVLRRFAADYPRMKVQLLSSFTRALKEQYRRGQADVILTTESACDPGGETLATRRLVWVGAPDGSAWRARPLRLAFERNCIFRSGVQRRLDEAGIGWEMAVDSDASRSIDATVSADLAVSARIEGTEATYLEQIDHGRTLPELREIQVNMYVADHGQGPAAEALAEMIRNAYAAV
ncbi:LysR family transcriptional regulator [Histidinibacterium aquaticum]|uniref:LysR family transcriptional regulator n=1 Tax=Histidinibacterium aquaticum TaxID=2613962 RepID=A0A5J5GS98_9RHOB|nr:LysR family transcriptional regulator [Histidinibacterium aquaticum]KAA9010202.1 LysR family transcriptional regulator [Histidinibacterium aquaticum]